MLQFGVVDLVKPQPFPPLVVVLFVDAGGVIFPLAPPFFPQLISFFPRPFPKLQPVDEVGITNMAGRRRAIEKELVSIGLSLKLLEPNGISINLCVIVDVLV